jgi:hypothetical protein
VKLCIPPLALQENKNQEAQVSQAKDAKKIPSHLTGKAGYLLRVLKAWVISTRRDLISGVSGFFVVVLVVLNFICQVHIY